jgi:uncharacterized protein (TIGR02300 family)
MKRICPNCGTRYYDFQKDPPACPVCGTVYDPEALLKSRRTRSSVVDEPAPKKKAAAKAVEPDEIPELTAGDDEIDTAIDDEEVEEGEDVVEADDDTLIEEDDDDLGEEIEEIGVDEPEEET